MTDLAYESLESSLRTEPLFEAKTWRLAPEAWPVSETQLRELEDIGRACLEYHQALENLYLRSAAGKNLLRNRPLEAPWVAEYLDRGKPPELVAHARDPRNRGAFPCVLRPDLLLTDDGFAMTELDSVPGGIGLTAYLNRIYAEAGGILGAGDLMVRNFHAAVAGAAPAMSNPMIALVVSDEAATYRPEMDWLARELQLQGRRVVRLRPEDLFPLGGALFFDSGGNPEKIDVIYRFFELFDLGNLRTAKFVFEAWAAGEVAITPPMRPFQEEKLGLALFHHHRLRDYWAEALGARTANLLGRLIPPSWVMDPAPLPPGAVLDGPRAAGRPISDWRELAAATQKERDLIIKIGGFHETAWGARSVVLGSDGSREEWQRGIERALELAPTNLHVLQTYRKPKRARHRVYRPGADGAPPEAREAEGRLRLCPYYFVVGGEARLSGALATFCPPDKKIIHGMQDAALLPVKTKPE
ncbi:MAG: hypothetical protein ACREFX_04560 [Opitutaceae bacterium]